MFLQAGVRSRNALVLFFGAKALCAIALVVIFIFTKLFLMRPMAPLFIMFFSVALALVGFYIPDIWLRIRTANRKDQITRAFPDALDLLVVCVEAGMGLDAAISRVAEEMSISCKVLSDELRLLNLEMRAGKARRDALQDLALRTWLDDVSNLVTLLIQTDKFGTSIAQALRVHSDSMRTKRYQRAEEMAMKLPVKLLFPLIFFIFPSLFVVIMGPALIRAWRIWSGH
jgi:tight adherence protein C